MMSLTALICVTGFSLFFLFQLSQAVRCYLCVYIGGQNKNPSCLSDVHQSSVGYEDGTACLTAIGKAGGEEFVLRRAFLPLQSKNFPMNQQAIACDDKRIISAKFGIALSSVGGRRVENITSCTLCNDREYCNSATKTDFHGVCLPYILTNLFIMILMNY